MTQTSYTLKSLRREVTAIKRRIRRWYPTDCQPEFSDWEIQIPAGRLVVHYRDHGGPQTHAMML